MASSRRTFLAHAAAAASASLVPAAPSAAAPGQDQGPRSKRAGETVLAFAGDLFLTAPFPAPHPPAAAQVFDVMRTADAAFANLENGLSTTGGPELGGYKWGGPLRGHPSLVRELTSLGIDAVSVANNHTGNYGREALLETLQTLDGAGIKHAGAGRNIDQAFAPVFLTVNGLNVAFFSLYSCHYGRVSQEVASDTLPGVACVRAYDVILEVPGRFEPQEKSTIFDLEVNTAQSVMAPLKEDIVRLQRAIASARNRADLIVLYVHFHWARHTRPGLPFHQRVVAHSAIDAGVDLFVAHGPHVVRGLEVYRGRPVLYSIGNFVLQGRAENARPTEGTVPLTEIGVMARAIIAADKSIELELLPIVLGRDGQPRFGHDATGKGIVDRLRGLSAEFDVEIAQKDWYGSLRVGPMTATAAHAGAFALEGETTRTR